MIIRGQEILFVDGYNVIHSWEKLKGLARVSLAGARQSLLDFMAEYQAYTGVKVVVVFDAQSTSGITDSKQTIGLEVVFTGADMTADDYIERQAHLLGKVKRIRVATSDYMEQQLVLSRGATRVSARELEMELYEMKRQIQSKERKRQQGEKESFLLVEDRIDPETKQKLEKLLDDKEDGHKGSSS